MSPQSHSELTQLKNRIAARLAGVRRSIRRHFLLEGAAILAVAVVAAAAITLLIDWQLELSRPARIAVLVIIAAGLAWLLFRRLWQPLVLPLSALDVAAAIDRTSLDPTQSRLVTRVATVLELSDAPEDELAMSPDLVLCAVRNSYRELESVSFARHLSAKHLSLSLLAIAVALAIPAGFAAAAPSVARLWKDRWLLGIDRPWPHSTTLEVVGLRNGAFIVPRGETAGLRVVVHDKVAPTENVWMRMTSTDGSDQTVTLTRFAEGDFRYELPPLQQPLEATVWGGDNRAEPFRIDPRDRPKFTTLKLTANHPREREPQSFDFTGEEGNVRLLPKTQAKLEFETNVPVEEVRVKTDGAGPRTFARVSDRKFSAEWTHEGQVRLETTLIAKDSGLESFARPISIGEKTDRPPTVSLRHSGVRLRVTAQATIPVTATIRDDYGIRSANIVTTIETAGEQEKPPEDAAKPTTPPSPAPAEESSDGKPPAEQPAAPPKPMRSESPLFGPADPAMDLAIEHQQPVELSALATAPGQSVTVIAGAEDDCFTGRQTASSRKIIFKVVKDEELFREILLRQQQLRARLQKSYEQMLDLKEKLKIADAATDGANLLRTYLLTRREVAAVSREIDASLTEMRLNKLGGEESWRLIETSVTKPLARLQEQEMERQKQAIETLVSSSPEAMDSVIERQQAINEALKKVLDNMSQWDSFIDIINQVNSIIKIQEAARRMTEELKAKQVESIFDM